MSLQDEGLSPRYIADCEAVLLAVRVAPGMGLHDLAEILDWRFGRVEYALSVLERCGEVIETLPAAADVAIARGVTGPRDWRGLGTYHATQHSDPWSELGDEPRSVRIDRQSGDQG